MKVDQFRSKQKLSHLQAMSMKNRRSGSQLNPPMRRRSCRQPFGALGIFAILAIATTSVSSSQLPQRTVLASATTSLSTDISSGPSDPYPLKVSAKQSPNPVVSLFSFVKNSVVRTVDSCGQLWTNHGKCNEIRKQMSQHREKVAQQWELQGLHLPPKELKKRLAAVQGGISYSDYMFLQKGKEDRGKVMNMAFLMWGAPKFLPYALMFNPDMLPSPFKQDKAAASRETPAQRLWRERSGIMMQTLADFERQALSVGDGGFLSMLNIFGREKQKEKQGKFVNVYKETREVLSQPVGISADSLLRKIKPLIYRSKEEFSRAETRLVHIPACLVKGVGRAINGDSAGGIFSSLQPHFLHRNKVLNHLRKVSDADDFLVQADIDLETISPRLLLETCSDRMVGGPDWTPEQLRSGLEDWLRMSVHEPANTMSKDSAIRCNSNALRLALIIFNGYQGARGLGGLEPTLTQLLLTQTTPPTTSTSTVRSGTMGTDSSDSVDEGTSRRFGLFSGRK